MARLSALLAVLAVAALVFLYLDGGGDMRGRTSPTRPADPVPVGDPAPAPAVPSAPAARVVRVRAQDTDGNPVADATLSRASGDPARTGADGLCDLPLPDGAWHAVTVRHPDFVPLRFWATASKPEERVTLQRGPRLTVLVTDPTRRPVEGAVVLARWERLRGPAGFWRWSDGDVLGEFRTGADGRAVVGAVPPATVVLHVDHPPFALHESRLDATDGVPIEHVIRLDAGGILVGRVLAPGGEGVAGATVRCQGLGRPVATSGPAGEFRLEGAPEGTAHLVAEAEGFGPGYFGAALGWGDPVPVPVRAGETVAGLEIVLSRPVYVTGRVVDEEKRPLKDVVAYATVHRGFSVSNEAKSGEDGRFRVGPYSVREPGRVWAWFNAPGLVIDQASAVAEPGRDVDLGEIRATRRATVRGILVDEGGSPVEGRILIQNGNALSAGSSKPDGTFDLGSVGPGQITLVAERAEEPRLRSRPLVLDTAAGQTIDGVEIVLLAAKSVRGRVITPDGKPRPGVAVGIRPADGPPAIDRQVTDGEGRFEFSSLAEGEYEVGVVGSGSSWDIGQEQAFLDRPAPARVAAGTDDVEFVLPLTGGVIVGKVVAKRDGRPVKAFDGAFLRYKLFIPTGTDFESYESESGEFRFETDVPGTWQVDISAAGFASHRTDRFSLGAGEVKDLGTIRLGPGGSVAGTVVDAQQRPVPYARINILNDKLQTNEDEPYTDLEGRFSVAGVSPGVFTVFAVSPRHPLGMIRGVAVREGERTEVQITFVEPAPLTVDVRDASGHPLEGAALDFTFPAVAPLTSKLFREKIPPGYGSHRSDAAGTIFQPCLPPGEVTITIEKPGFEPATRRLDLKAGESNRVEIRLRAASGR